jgi:hypothetical protein
MINDKSYHSLTLYQPNRRGKAWYELAKITPHPDGQIYFYNVIEFGYMKRPKNAPYIVLTDKRENG